MDAEIVSEGEDNLTFRAPSDGMVYVYEKNNDKVLYSGKVDRGDTLRLDADKRHLTLNGDPVSERNLAIGSDHVIRFQRDDEPDNRTVILQRRTVTRDVD